MPLTREATGNVFVSHHLLVINDADGRHPEGTLLRPVNGLVAVSEGVAVVRTGIHTGLVTLDIHLHDTQPTLDTAGWDEVVDITFHTSAGHLWAHGLMDDPPPHLPYLAPAAGTYQIRVHAYGRDNADDPDVDEPSERLRLSAWEVPHRATTIVHKQSDHCGSEIRNRYAT